MPLKRQTSWAERSGYGAPSALKTVYMHPSQAFNSRGCSPQEKWRTVILPQPSHLVQQLPAGGRDMPMLILLPP